MSPAEQFANQELEYVSITDERVRLHERNPNEGDVGAISQSIEANGFVGAILVQRSSGRIVAGNHRYLAARALGMETIPVMWIDVDDTTATRLLLADNRLTRLGHFQEDSLTMLLAELAQAEALEGSGFDYDDLDLLLARLNDDAEPPPPPTFKCSITFSTQDERDEAVRRLQDMGYAVKV